MAGPARNIAIFMLLFAASPMSARAADGVEQKVQLCASCHGQNGAPGDTTIPILWGQQKDYLEKQLRDYKSGDRDSQIMSSMAESLKDADIPQVATFFADKHWPVPPAAATVAKPDIIAACEGCHGANLEGGPSPEGVTPRLAGQFSNYLGDTMTAYAKGERGGSATMVAIMKNLSADDRKAVALYLASL